jgi:hypothetical protein
MRKLAAVAIVLSVTAACSNQPTATASPPTGTEAKSATGVLASPTAATAPHPFTQSPWSPGAQSPEMWSRDPATDTNDEIPRYRL